MLEHQETRKEVHIHIKLHKLNVFTNLMIANTIFIFCLGVLMYGEKFQMRDFAYSYLGMTRTPGGHENTLSFLIYVTGCLLNSYFCFKISNILTVKFHKILFTISGTGYLLLILPCNLLNILHTLGGLLVFSAMWFYLFIVIIDIYQSGKRYRALFYGLLLNGTVLPYGYLYSLHSHFMQVAQKIALLGLIIVLKLVITEQTRVRVELK